MNMNGLKVVTALVGTVIPLCVHAQEKSYGEDVAFLRKHTRIVELKSKDVAVAIAPDYQARIMTSTAQGGNGYGFGWLNYPVIEKGLLRAAEAKGKLEEHIYVFGGEERLWLGPEGGQFGLFFPKGAKFDFASWKTPPALDTEPFETVSVSPESATFRRAFPVSNWTGTSFDVQLSRTVTLLSPTQLAERWKVTMPPGARAVAYETENRLTNSGKNAWRPDTGLLSIWVLGMYKPSPKTTIVIPFKTGDDRALGMKVNDVYFGKIPAERLKVRDAVLFFRGDGGERGKIGITPHRSLGIAGSYSADVDALTLVLCSKPQGSRYVNSLWTLQEHPYAGDAINSYNDGSPEPGKPPLGPFYELETSSSAAELKPGESLEHRQVTIHVMGSKESLDALSSMYLKASIKDIETAFK